MGARVVVVIGVARGGGVENGRHAWLFEPSHGFLEGLGESTPAPTVVGSHHVLAVDVLEAVKVLETLDSAGSGPATERTEELAGGDADGPVDPHNPDTIVATGADGPCHVGAVTVVVHGVAAVSDSVDSVKVVDVSVSIIVDAVGHAGAVRFQTFPGVIPDILDEVLVVVIHPGVDDANDQNRRPGGACSDVPRLRSVDVGVGRAPTLPGVVQAPELVELLITGSQLDGEEVVQLRIFDNGVRL